MTRVDIAQAVRHALHLAESEEINAYRIAEMPVGETRIPSIEYITQKLQNASEIGFDLDPSLHSASRLSGAVFGRKSIL